VSFLQTTCEIRHFSPTTQTKRSQSRQVQSTLQSLNCKTTLPVTITPELPLGLMHKPLALADY